MLWKWQFCNSRTVVFPMLSFVTHVSCLSSTVHVQLITFRRQPITNFVNKNLKTYGQTSRSVNVLSEVKNNSNAHLLISKFMAPLKCNVCIQNSMTHSYILCSNCTYKNKIIQQTCKVQFMLVYMIYI